MLLSNFFFFSFFSFSFFFYSQVYLEDLKLNKNFGQFEVLLVSMDVIQIFFIPALTNNFDFTTATLRCKQKFLFSSFKI